MKNKILNITLVSIMLAGSCLVNVANAGYIVNGGKDNFINNGVITTEYRADGTVWEWLDLTVTNGISYNDIVNDLTDDNKLNASVTFTANASFSSNIAALSTTDALGWATVSSNDLAAMFSRFFDGEYISGNTYTGTSLSASSSDIETFIGLFGDTLHEGSSDPANIGQTWGATSSYYNSTYIYSGLVYDYQSATKDYSDLVRITSTYTATSERADIGTWLVREAAQVPEPASIAIFSLGLLGLAASRRRRSV
ncbi:PEP-CTERM sorting domain-containing protein [Neptunicella sp.]|uniref:PEP-CTERM sorting domain-containing protein n=1 Tax=Neptunicella sp. TaxID=2125986 RepID=UPI003F68C2FA